MNAQQAIQHIQSKLMSNDPLASLTCRHWAIVFYCHKDKLIKTYDASDPLRGVKALQKAHPDLEYLELLPCSNSAAANEYVKACTLYGKIYNACIDKLETK